MSEEKERRISWNTFFSVPRALACVWCYRMNGMVLFQFCRTQLAYLWLARLLARLETSQECLVRGTRWRARERQPKTPGPSVAIAAPSLDHWTLCPRHSMKSSGAAATQQGADGSVRGTPWGARERQHSPRAPSFHPTRFRLVGLRPASEVWRHGVLVYSVVRRTRLATRFSIACLNGVWQSWYRGLHGF